jgi:signal transduction histidine kinase
MNVPTISAAKGIGPLRCRSTRPTEIDASHELFTKHLIAPLTSATVRQETPVSDIPLKPYGPVFLALAHEVRNPLTNINLAVDMLVSEMKDDNLKMYLDIINRSSIRINDVLTHLLKYEDAVKVAAESHSIHQMLEEVLELAMDRIILKKISVTKEFISADIRLTFNRPEIKIAVTNIVINAIEAMSPGKGELRLITCLSDGKFQLRIEDNGCGIGKEDLKKIFKPFFTSRPGGLGLGLSTTDNALRLNRIALDVESEVGVGTSFILSFNHQ